MLSFPKFIIYNEVIANSLELHTDSVGNVLYPENIVISANTTSTLNDSSGLRGHSEVTSITFEPNSQLSTISEYGFAGMSNLSTIDFRNCTSNTITIYSNSFRESSLDHILMRDNQKFVILKENQNDTNTKINLPYFSTSGMSDFLSHINGGIPPQLIYKIGNTNYYSHINFTTLNIPRGVTELPTGFFSIDNSSVNNYKFKITFEQENGTLTRINDSAFHCILDDELILPEGLEYLGEYAFGYYDAGSHYLTKVVLPSTLTSIKGWAISSHKNLTDISFRNADSSEARDPLIIEWPGITYNNNVNWSNIDYSIIPDQDNNNAKWYMIGNTSSGYTSITYPNNCTQLGVNFTDGIQEFVSLYTGRLTKDFETGSPNASGEGFVIFATSMSASFYDAEYVAEDSELYYKFNFHNGTCSYLTLDCPQDFDKNVYLPKNIRKQTYRNFAAHLKDNTGLEAKTFSYDDSHDADITDNVDYALYNTAPQDALDAIAAKNWTIVKRNA